MPVESISLISYVFCTIWFAGFCYGRLSAKAQTSAGDPPRPPKPGAGVGIPVGEAVKPPAHNALNDSGSPTGNAMLSHLRQV